MIKEAYVSLEVAKLLKEKGFDIPVNYEYHYKITIPQFHRKKHDFNGNEYRYCSSEWYSAPTHQMAMAWLREKYHLHIWIDYSRLDFNEKQPYLWNIVETKIDGDYWGGTYHKTYEEAAELAIKYTLENLI